MSFMFKPLAYDDPKAVNRIALPQETVEQITVGNKAVAEQIASYCTRETLHRERRFVLAVDGYVSAQFEDLTAPAAAILRSGGKKVRLLDMKELYKSQEEIDRLTQESLPLNYEDDPVLLFGRLYRGKIDDFIDADKAKKALEDDGSEIILHYGLGSASDMLRSYVDAVAYIDVTPKAAAIRAREKRFVNIGDRQGRPFSLLMRRNYYVDFEVAVQLRKKLLKENRIALYILGSDENNYVMMPGQVLGTVLSALVRYPFRAKPVYLEGIWGGEYIRKIRNLPQDIAPNVAWVFDMIPMEVSIVVETEKALLDIPFSTFVQARGTEMMGERCVKEFDGYFPIRFNYDDTWHSDGNMSVQVHPDEEFVIENYDEFGRQDEAYYVIATGHGARTYCGFCGDGREFLELAKQSETTHEDIDYRKYINSVESIPGRQIMLPAGTVHASGRNQLILELGSLTIGSYTYKVYDYNRKDRDGNTRPIHTKNAEKVLHFERDSKWVRENIAIDPLLVEETKDYTEYVVGRTELMYYETRRVELATHGVYEGKNNGQFTVVTVVDGESVHIYSRSRPEFCFDASFLDIVTIPATIEDYVIEATGYQPVVIHKTLLKEGYTRYKNPKYNDRKQETDRQTENRKG